MVSGCTAHLRTFEGALMEASFQQTFCIGFYDARCATHWDPMSACYLEFSRCNFRIRVARLLLVGETTSCDHFQPPHPNVSADFCPSGGRNNGRPRVSNSCDVWRSSTDRHKSHVFETRGRPLLRPPLENTSLKRWSQQICASTIPATAPCD